MIRTYSDSLIVLDSKVAMMRGGTKRITVIAETSTSGNPKEVKINFYGRLAESISEKLVPGMKFTYRGFITIESGEPTLVGQTFALIA